MRRLNPAGLKGTARQRYDDGRANSDVVKFRNSAAWQRCRAAYRAAHPLCCLCEQAGKTILLASVHHVVGLEQRLDLGLDHANLRGLCSEHHSMVEAMERAGKHTQHLFSAEQF